MGLRCLHGDGNGPGMTTWRTGPARDNGARAQDLGPREKGAGPGTIGKRPRARDNRIFDRILGLVGAAWSAVELAMRRPGRGGIPFRRSLEQISWKESLVRLVVDLRPGAADFVPVKAILSEWFPTAPFRLEPGSQGCAGWAWNPNRPQVEPFCHQVGRHATSCDIGTGILRRISVRRSPGVSALNLNLLF